MNKKIIANNLTESQNIKIYIDNLSSEDTATKAKAAKSIAQLVKNRETRKAIVDAGGIDPLIELLSFEDTGNDRSTEVKVYRPFLTARGEQINRATHFCRSLKIFITSLSVGICSTFILFSSIIFLAATLGCPEAYVFC